MKKLHLLLTSALAFAGVALTHLPQTSWHQAGAANTQAVTIRFQGMVGSQRFIRQRKVYRL